jgi:folate-dependent tRNA-U54 methylase TrmFO/GidA
LEERGIIEINKEGSMLVKRGPALAKEEVENLRVERAALYIYQAVIPVIMNNAIEIGEQEEDYVISLQGQLSSSEMREG